MSFKCVNQHVLCSHSPKQWWRVPLRVMLVRDIHFLYHRCLEYFLSFWKSISICLVFLFPLFILFQTLVEVYIMILMFSVCVIVELLHGKCAEWQLCIFGWMLWEVFPLELMLKVMNIIYIIWDILLCANKFNYFFNLMGERNVG